MKKDIAKAVTIGGWSLAVIFLVALTLNVRDFLLKPDTLPFKNVRVQGALTHLDRGGLAKTVERSIDGGYFAVDIDAIQQEVERLSWVEKSTIRRRWPDTLVMTVIEHEPFARWGEGRIVSTKGKVFVPENANTLTLPYLYGPNGTAGEVVTAYKALAKNVVNVGWEVVRLGMDNRQEWSATFDNGLQLMMGHFIDEHKVKKLVGLYASLNSEGRTPGRIDMRYNHGFAVSWVRVDVEKTNRGNG